MRNDWELAKGENVNLLHGWLTFRHQGGKNKHILLQHHDDYGKDRSLSLSFLHAFV